jgi:hypothetical protein
MLMAAEILWVEEFDIDEVKRELSLARYAEGGWTSFLCFCFKYQLGAVRPSFSGIATNPVRR